MVDVVAAATGVAATVQPAAPDPSGTISVCANVSVWFANQLATERAIAGLYNP